MIKIPSQGKFSQPNNSDKFGNLHVTKNINLDEEGYIKLSPRAVAMIDSGNTDDVADAADWNIPTAFGRESTFWAVATTDEPFEINISENGLYDAASDNGTNNPALTFDSRGVWWRNLWHVTDNDDLLYRTPSTGNWTDANVTLTSSKIHPLEVFRSLAQLCIGNGNTVIMVDTSYSTTKTLTIPTDFEVVALAYNDNQMGIVTKLSDSADGQNQDAHFFVWDGTAAAAQRSFGVGSDVIVAVKPYKSSWVLLTRAGQLLYFNGGGFDVLTNLPLYYLDRIWGDSRNLEAFGDILLVDGDIIYIHINNAVEPYGEKSQEAVPTSPGGILCYDPKVGLYHRVGPSISLASRLAVTQANVNDTTNVLTKSEGTIPPTGSPVKYVNPKTGPIGGLVVGRVYFIIKDSSTEFRLATTKANALVGSAIDLTDTGSAVATNYFLALNLYDFGASYMARTGAVAKVETPNHLIHDLIFGGELYPIDSASNREYLNFTCTGFENRGYFTTPKIFSDQVTDTAQRAVLKFRPLKTTDSIILKYRNKDVVGLPVTTAASGNTYINWTSPSEFYTTQDLSEAKTYIDGGGALECEAISGAGGGAMAQITSIATDSGTYSVVLAEEIPGAASGRLGEVIINNWQVLKTATSADNERGYIEISTKNVSKFHQFKVEMRGSEVTVEEFALQNISQQMI